MDEKKKEGLTVKELGDLGNKYRSEVFLCLLLLVSCIFNFIFVGGYLSILTIVLGAIFSSLFAPKIESFLKSMITFPLQQPLGTQLVIGTAVLVIGIFLPCIIFLFLGLFAGQAIYKNARL